MEFSHIHKVYFLGVGGIGMSALARYFQSQGKHVSGYDRTRTKLTQQLEEEGIAIHYEDWGKRILTEIEKEGTLVVYTPAIPEGFTELSLLLAENYWVVKRAKALGIISSQFETFAIAGTHGKTTTSAILAHVLAQTPEKCNAFIGGISTNYNSNCIIHPEADRVVVEADEFDRSFLQLKPNYAIVTTMDSDHLDIYGHGDELRKSFNEFINRVNPKGSVGIQVDLDINDFEWNETREIWTYGLTGNPDWKGENLRYVDGVLHFDIRHRDQVYADVAFGLPGKHNAENALAVFALCVQVGVEETDLRNAFRSFLGVKRRFEYHIRRDDLVMIDDYAHHPTEITAFLSALKEIYPTRKITTVFQPHLFSRTRDFMADFATSLALSDRLYLLPIYPARELPIEGVTSEVLLEKIEVEEKWMSSKEQITEDLRAKDHELVVIVGAGDIDTCISPIVKQFSR